ncbi:uncharacterized protein LOC111882200 [Lactuca sativa]|uniref:uncharacterized protein LOC111882200 n=1 Tax=Lactuca sativa TaxID=4236 RepID=UPI000CD893C5|nr:uncharacterized protein LOC111882200 [Lactuca sativa]
MKNLNERKRHWQSQNPNYVPPKKESSGKGKEKLKGQENLIPNAYYSKSQNRKSSIGPQTGSLNRKSSFSPQTGSQNRKSIFGPKSSFGPSSISNLVKDVKGKGKLNSEIHNKKKSANPKIQKKTPKPFNNTPTNTPKIKQDKIKIKVIRDEQFDDEWYIDSGWSLHMTGRKEEQREFGSLKDGGSMKYGNNSYGTIKGYGMRTNGDFSIRKVAYVEGLQHNLINASQLVVGTCLKKLDDTPKLKMFIKQVEVQLRKTVRIIRSDNGLEFKNKEFEDFLDV